MGWVHMPFPFLQVRTLSHRKVRRLATWRGPDSSPGKVTPEVTLLSARIYFVRDKHFLTPFVRRYQVSPSSDSPTPQQSSSVYQILLLPRGMPPLPSFLLSGILQASVSAAPGRDSWYNMPPTWQNIS